MLHCCCAHNQAFTAVWILMTQRGLACSARRDGMHLGSAIRSADLKTFTSWLSGHYRRKIVKCTQLIEPRSALWPWIIYSILETKSWGVSEEDRRTLMLNLLYQIETGLFGIFEKFKSFLWLYVHKGEWIYLLGNVSTLMHAWCIAHVISCLICKM